MAGSLAVVAFVLGLNEAVTLPRALFADPDDAAARLEERARKAAEVGATAVRIQTSSWPWLAQALESDPPDWTRVDAALGLLTREQLDAVVVVAPWPANQPWTAADDCRIYDRDGWGSRVAQLVERYDGDGLADAPDVRAVLAWEVHNEPDLHEHLKPGFCPPAVYRDTLAITAAAIREADPDATVLSGGVYRPGTKTGMAWMEGLGGAPEAGAIGLHLYPDDDDDPEAFVARAFGNARAAFGDRPLWVTEASAAGERGGVGESGEVDQARALVRLVVAAWEAGAQGFFWHTLADPPDQRAQAVPHPGLFAVDGIVRRTKAHTPASSAAGEPNGLGRLPKGSSPGAEDAGGKPPVGRQWERARGRIPEAARLREKPAAEAFRRLRGLTGEVGADGDLRWVRVDGGWLVWPVGPAGDGRPPGPVVGIAGGNTRTRADGTAWIRGLAFSSVGAEPPR